MNESDLDNLVHLSVEDAVDRLLKGRPSEMVTETSRNLLRTVVHAALVTVLGRLAADPCEHPWHSNPGLITPCPECGAGASCPPAVDVKSKGYVGIRERIRERIRAFFERNTPDSDELGLNLISNIVNAVEYREQCIAKANVGVRGRVMDLDDASEELKIAIREGLFALLHDYAHAPENLRL
jgi:hypothetical protein